MATAKRTHTSKRLAPQQINAISVSGYKSLRDRQRIDISDLTVLAGTNSSGKSSMLQPVLLVKQTLDAAYDPGALLLDGPNVRFTSAGQLLSKLGAAQQANGFDITFHSGKSWSAEMHFQRILKRGLDLNHITINEESKAHRISKSSSSEDIAELLRAEDSEMNMFYRHFVGPGKEGEAKWTARRDRCFYQFELKQEDRTVFGTSMPKSHVIQQFIKTLIHVPGLRGNPARTYKTTAVSSSFPGTFEVYIASIVNAWQESKDDNLAELGHCLEELGLTWKVRATRVDDTQVELKVGRLTHGRRGGQHDLVSIADVGFGMSQVLPVVVALLAAKRGQVVYIEQPEIHLHPRAQSAMADVIAKATGRGVRVIIETHSALLLLRIQTLVASDKLDSKKVKLHWFRRSENGQTNVTEGQLDDSGAFGQWPEDFGEVILAAQSQYLDAAERKLLGG